MTIQLAKDQAAQERGYDQFESIIDAQNQSSAYDDDFKEIINRALEIYSEAKAKEANEYTKSLEDEVKFHCSEKNRLEKVLEFEKQNATDFASKADHYRNLLSEAKKEAYTEGVKDWEAANEKANKILDKLREKSKYVEAYNQGVRDAAESAKTHQIDGYDFVDKQSILKLLK